MISFELTGSRSVSLNLIIFLWVLLQVQNRGSNVNSP